MLVDPRGRTIVSRQTLAMSPEQVRWLLNGKAFLRHIADLPLIHLAVSCKTCTALGLNDSVQVGLKEPGVYGLRCAHNQSILHARDVTDTSTLLLKLGWTLHCTSTCARLGEPDGVEANNDPTGGMAHVRCGCTDRLFQLGPVH